MEEETNTQNNENEEEFKEEKGFKKSIPWATIFIILSIFVAAFLIIKYPIKSHPDLDCDIACCIGNKSILVATKGCGACHKQIELLGDNKGDFNIIYCDESSQFCLDNQIMAVPTWIINEERIVGVQSIDKLKELTNC